MAETKIEWAKFSWNPVVGCTRVSAGCDNCYAVQQTRLCEVRGSAKYAGLVNADKRHFNGVVRCVPEALDIPLKRRKATVWFVNSMSDLFHADVPFEFIDQVFAVMALCPQHVFIILTKRPERMAEYMNRRKPIAGSFTRKAGCDWKTPCDSVYEIVRESNPSADLIWPLPNVILGTSVEDQATAEERIPHLLKCPAACRAVSYEPALGPVDFVPYMGRMTHECACGFHHDEMGLTPHAHLWRCMECGEKTNDRRGVDWLIVGGESGAKARNCYVSWIRSTIQQGRESGTPVFVKQLGRNWKLDGNATQVSVGGVYGSDPARGDHPKGGDMNEWPEDLRRREMPELIERITGAVA